MAENEFPKMFHCPKCGSEKTVVGLALAPLKISGEVPAWCIWLNREKVDSIDATTGM